MPLGSGPNITLFAVLEADKRLLRVLRAQQSALMLNDRRSREISAYVSEALHKCSAIHQRAGASRQELTELESIACKLEAII